MNLVREKWDSNIGFIFASIGSAVGIGNIWRFPYLVGENGGGAFLIPYIFTLATFGLVLLLLEFTIGRYYQTSIIGCLGKIRKKFKWFGVFTVTITTIILSYYLVILGWIFAFLIIIVFVPNFTFNDFTNSFYPIISFLIILVINFLIIRRGVSGGIEKLNKFGVLILVSLLVPLTIYGLLLPNSERGIEYYLTPDFSKFIEYGLWGSVFGQVFFSLSIGFGSLVAFGSYLKERKSLLKSSSIILVADGAISFVAGIMIFSILFSFDMDPQQGASLIFQVMPKVFASMDYGLFIGITFFFLLLIAGITSSIGLFQVPVSALEDSLRFDRNKSVLIITGVVATVGLLPALSYSMINLQVFGMQVLDFMDMIFGTYGITISAILFSITVLWFLDRKVLHEQLSIGEHIKFPLWLISTMKYTIPTLIVVTIIFNALKLLKIT